MTLRPGVVQTPGGGTLTTAVHGLAPSQNNNFIEGLDSNDPLTGQNITNTTLPWGDAATILPVDAIQELNVETNAPAEFGRRPGAVINVGLKTGGNAIHGSAFAYGRDSALNANDYVNPLGGPPSTQAADEFGAIGRHVRRAHHQEQAFLFRRLRAGDLQRGQRSLLIDAHVV